MNGIVTREDLIVQSVETRTRAILDDRGYNVVRLVDSFPGVGAKLDVTQIAAGFNFDDGGEGAECGSDLRRRQHTIEFFVLGTDAIWARNVAAVVKGGLESDPNGTLALLDVESSNAVIDYLLVDSVGMERQIVPDPEPWQEHVYTIHLKITDEYFASQVV